MPPTSSRALETNIVVIEITEDTIRIGFSGQLRHNAEKRLNPYWQRNIKSVKTKISLLKAFTSLFYDYLLISPNTHRAVVVDHWLWSVDVKRTITHLLLAELQVASVLFIPSAVCSAIGARRTDALVVDIGWFETFVCPVYDFRHLVSCTKVTKGIVPDIGAEKRTRGNEAPFPLHQAIDEDSSIGQVTKFKTYMHEASSQSNDLEELIEEKEYPDDNERSIPTIIDIVLTRLDITCRQSCQSSIIITGSFGSIPNLSQRILQRVRSKWNDAALTISTSAWTGASVHASSINWPLTGRLKGELTLDRYLGSENKIIFEWIFEGP